MNSLSEIKNRLFRAALTLVVGITFLSSTLLVLGNSSNANAAALTPEATQYQVDGNPFQAEQDAGEKNAQDTANRLFQENKQPLEAPETTQKIGEALTKPAKATKQKLEGIAGNIKDTAEDVQNTAKNAYEDQKTKPKTNVKNVFETVKEKLNLDEPIYPGTKEFINDVEEKAEETVKGSQQAVKKAIS